MMSQHIKPWNPMLFARTSNQHPDLPNTTSKWTSSFHPCSNEDDTAVDEWTAQPLYNRRTPRVQFSAFFCPSDCIEDAAVNRPAKSITQLILCQFTTDEVDAATKLLDKACQKLRGIPDSHLRGSLTHTHDDTQDVIVHLISQSW